MVRGPLRKRSQPRKRRGQAIIEYVLMVGLISTLATGFIKFLVKDIFKDGLTRLPECAGGLMSSGLTNPNNCGEEQ